MDCSHDKLIETLLGTDKGQYTTKLFGVQDDKTFDKKNEKHYLLCILNKIVIPCYLLSEF